MSVTIRRAVNGWVVNRPLDDSDDDSEWVYSHDMECDESEVVVFARLLRDINDFIGPETSRYSAKRIHVVVEPGDKYEPPK